MVHRIINKTILLAAIIFVASLQSCYYDNEEDLYPQPPPCDTSFITYSESIWPVINDNCTNCHSGSAPSGNIRLSNYDEIVDAANDGSLLGTIRHDAGWSPMPKGGAKLPDCDITKIEMWVADGSPDN